MASVFKWLFNLNMDVFRVCINVFSLLFSLVYFSEDTVVLQFCVNEAESVKATNEQCAVTSSDCVLPKKTQQTYLK